MALKVADKGADSGGREFGPADMDERQFQQWATLVERRTGMRLSATRKSFLLTNLRQRMRELGCGDFQTYYDYLHTGRTGAVEWAALVDRLTVHETRFFRHPNSLALVREHFLPRYIATHEPPASLQAWSVGCSTGDEPYSLAIVIDDYLAELGRDYYLGVTASDISLPSLAIGRRAIYHQSRLKNVEPGVLARHFVRHGSEQYQVRARLRKRVCFNHLNVLELGDTPLGLMDLIMCQNLLIYFDRELRREILDNLVRFLAPGGVLLLGVGEAIGWSHPALHRISFRDTLAFERHDGERKA